MISLLLTFLRHRLARNFLAIFSVGAAVAALLFIFSLELGFAENTRRESEQMGAHILLVPKGCPYDSASMALYGAAWPCYLPAFYLKEAASFPEIKAATPILMISAPDNRQRQIIEGIEPGILEFKKQWHVSGRLPSSPHELLAGSQVAAEKNWKLGAEVELPGTEGQKATVVGLLAGTASADDRFAYVTLSWAQKLFQHPGEITHVLVKLHHPQDLDAATKKLRGCDAGMSMNVVPLAHLYHSISNILRSSRFLLFSLAAASMMAAMGMVIANSSAVAFERMRDLGLLRALGATRPQLFLLIIAFTFTLCLAGALVGALLFTAASPLLETWVKMHLSAPGSSRLIHWSWLLLIPAAALPVLMGALSGLLPAWRASRVSPALLLQEFQT